ncbi:MAG: S41 family peptidase [Oscillospiraceae bacterium]|nr:S41 family peptidase [Oscillospiraceae bacterium]
MSYGFRAHAEISPSQTRRSDYNGKIWLLTSDFTGSAAQVATWLFKESGLATLVGDVTAGYFGGERIRRYLPSTGIPFIFDVLYFTDHNGRPLEAGTIPHHFNRPGMDAMETVLALIAEGEY